MHYRFVVGLGNPGERYRGTRHNVGFEVVEELFRRWSINPRTEIDVRWGEVFLEDQKVVVAQPLTYMNRSGEPTKRLLEFFGFSVPEVVVVYDDIDLPVGQLRLTQGGGEGGHNGLRSLTQMLGSKGYSRVRVGVGRPEDPRWDIAEWVLSRFAPEEVPVIEKRISEGADAVEALLKEGVKKAQNRFNAQGLPLSGKAPGAENSGSGNQGG